MCTPCYGLNLSINACTQFYPHVSNLLYYYQELSHNILSCSFESIDIPFRLCKVWWIFLVWELGLPLAYSPGSCCRREFDRQVTLSFDEVGANPVFGPTYTRSVLLLHILQAKICNVPGQACRHFTASLIFCQNCAVHILNLYRCWYSMHLFSF